MRARYYLPLAGFVIPTVAIAYGFVIPRSCIAGINETAGTNDEALKLRTS